MDISSVHKLSAKAYIFDERRYLRVPKLILQDVRAMQSITTSHEDTVHYSLLLSVRPNAMHSIKPNTRAVFTLIKFNE